MLQGWAGRLHLLLATAAGLLLGCGLLAVLWIAVFQRVDPVLRQSVVSVDPPDRVLDRDLDRPFRIVREVCSARDEQLQLTREWTDWLPGGGPRPVVLFTRLFTDLRAGCHLYPIEHPVSDKLPPGLYVYEATLRACNALNQCADHRLEPVAVAVTGGNWPKGDVPPPPALPPAMRAAPAPP